MERGPTPPRRRKRHREFRRRAYIPIYAVNGNGVRTPEICEIFPLLVVLMGFGRHHIANLTANKGNPAAVMKNEIIARRISTG